MDEHDEKWQTRIRELYSNVEELYSHVEISILVFDRDLRPEATTDEQDASREIIAELVPALTDVARRVLDTGVCVRDVPLDSTGRRRAHGHPLRQAGVIVGVACVVEDDSARRELFVRCALAIFDGYRENEVALLAREREALEEARRANRLRDQFMATISHELRAPLAAILLWEEVLRSDDVDGDTRTRALDAIRESANAQTLLVADLLDVSRAINGKLHIDLRATSIENVLRTAIERARPSANLRGLRIVAQLEPNVVAVLGDSRRLQQIFDNLLSNAIKFTQHGQISVRSRHLQESVVIDVEDTGRGIAAEFLPFIFEPFSQDEGGETRDGLGLGLAIARQLVDLHRGTLTARSAGLGCGATFTVSIPCMLDTAPSAETPTSVPQQLDGARILVVDDDPRLLEALRVLLGRAGAVVATAESTLAAYELVTRERFDVVLSDLSMPGEDGCSLARRIRDTPALVSLPVIALTAHITDHQQRRALAAGFDRCLGKPIDIPALISNIVDLVTTVPTDS